MKTFDRAIESYGRFLFVYDNGWYSRKNCFLLSIEMNPWFDTFDLHMQPIVIPKVASLPNYN
jgi:hypothetical protein